MQRCYMGRGGRFCWKRQGRVGQFCRTPQPKRRGIEAAALDRRVGYSPIDSPGMKMAANMVMDDKTIINT